MAGLVSKPLPSGKRRAWFMDWRGKQIFFTGTTNPKETLRMAERAEDRHRRIKLGDLPPPKASDNARPYLEVAGEYLDYGTANGGHGGRPWSPVHADVRTRHVLTFWPGRLNLTTLLDITLPKVESVARELLGKGKAGKTVQMHVESLKALCLWAKGRGYLDANPLEGIPAFDCTPKTTRRAMTIPEIVKLLEVASADRRLIYETALCTGYRKGELTALTVQDLDVERCTLKLAAKHSKGRKDSRQPIPAALAAKLKAKAGATAGNVPLFEVDFHIDRLFTRDLEAANVPVMAPGGKLVFHSLRHTYCSLVIESGASLTEAQRLLRHVDPRLTANVYSHARQDRLQSTAEAVGAMVVFGGKHEQCMQRVAVAGGGGRWRFCNCLCCDELKCG